MDRLLIHALRILLDRVRRLVRPFITRRNTAPCCFPPLPPNNEQDGHLPIPISITESRPSRSPSTSQLPNGRDITVEHLFPHPFAYEIGTGKYARTSGQCFQCRSLGAEEPVGVGGPGYAGVYGDESGQAQGERQWVHDRRVAATFVCQRECQDVEHRHGVQ